MVDDADLGNGASRATDAAASDAAAIAFDSWIDVESSRFAAAIGWADADAQVPTCPEWRADDLLWHLGKVQDFWATIVVEGFTDAEQVQRISPTRPEDRPGLMDFFDRARRRLTSSLSAVSDDAIVWTWSEDHTAGFVRRRQAHEALIHRVDAELVAGHRTPMDPELCVDGIDEVLRIMYGGAPAWGTFTPDGRTLGLETTDIERSWLVGLGRFYGDDPDAGPVDEADIRVIDGEPADAAAHVSGTAADLVCWLWHRPPLGEIGRRGDRGTLDAFGTVVSFPIN